mgnify:CR=1 FL=1
MPMINVQMFEGRTIEQRRALAKELTEGTCRALGDDERARRMADEPHAWRLDMAAAMALMESPAIIFAIALASKMRSKLAVQPGPQAVAPMGFKGVLHESLTDGAQFLLLGSIAIGLLTGQEGKLAMEPFTGNLFKGMLAFFLLDMGVSAAKNLPKLRGQTPWIYVYALSAPLVHAALALLLGFGLGIKAGDLALLMVLAASASYIAVPAVLKHSMPEANSALYLGMSLGITLPLNLVIGIPLYVYVAFRVAGA